MGGRYGASYFFVFLLLAFDQASARVFSFKNETLAGYFRGSMAMSRLERSPYSFTTDSTVQYSGDKHIYNYSGEIGFLINIGEMTTFRVGVELIQSKESQVVGSNNSGTKLFDLVSDVFVFNTTGTLEYHFYRTDTSRLSVFAGIGLSSVSMDLDYTFTPDGLSAFGLGSDYSDKSSSYIIGGHGGIQYEFLFADTATMALESGFRHLPVSKLNYEQGASTVYGPVTQGSQTRNSDGSDRTLDLSGFYLALGFRFYLNFM